MTNAHLPLPCVDTDAQERFQGASIEALGSLFNAHDTLDRILDTLQVMDFEGTLNPDSYISVKVTVHTDMFED